MDSRRISRERQPIRTSFTKATRALQDEIDKKECADIELIKLLFCQLQDKNEHLEDVQARMQTALLDEDVDEAAYEQDFEAAENYQDKFQELREATDRLLQEKYQPVPLVAGDHASMAGTDSENRRRFKLPKLELRKFDGDSKGWLGFWSLFQKIDEDADIAVEDKFQYLIQCMVPNTRAANLVNSFPATRENYPKAIAQLKDRFAREDLLVQVYVRELLAMVMSNAVSGGSKTNLSTLYDKLESQLRALESLGRTKAQSADFLAPLVESCLPEDSLRMWERKRGEEETNWKDSGLMLEKLMEFLRREVNGEEMFRIARGGFAQNKPASTSGATRKPHSSNATPTAAALITTEDGKVQAREMVQLCIFCDRKHASAECFSARNKTLEENRDWLRGKGICFACLRKGHSSKNCRASVKCMVCSKKHFPLMCPELAGKTKDRANGSSMTEAREKGKKSNTQSETVAGNAATVHACSATGHHLSSTVVLKTLLVCLANGCQTITIRAVLDDCSQRTYISTKVVRALNLIPTREDHLIHSLLGGLETPMQKHAVHSLEMRSCDGFYRCHLEALEQAKVCGRIPLLDRNIMGDFLVTELNLLVQDEGPEEIDLLIGADLLGRLVTGKIRRINEDLVALQTTLGWTIMGKVKSEPSNDGYSSALISMTLHSMNTSVNKLWQLDVLGIEDPQETLKKEDHHAMVMKKFLDSVARTPEGRYQVHLPWREHHRPLPDNRALARKRLEKTQHALRSENLFKDYSDVFSLWLREQFIEEITTEQSAYGHYLPHRPVIKEDSTTTKIRPVFDASAHKSGEPSLNDCLETGPNLIEQIPDILERFRVGAIGIVADIERAFQQIEVVPEHCDFLRFYSPCGKKLYRHRRVVFGVVSSPFLLGAVIKHHLAQVPAELKNSAKQLESSFYVDNCVASMANIPSLEKFVRESRLIMEASRMNLRGWESNSTSSYTVADDKDVDLLGLKWNLMRDTLRCNLTHLQSDDKKITKRNILSVAHQVFDPIGFTAPATLPPKLLLQETWELKVGWDDPLPEHLVNSFEAWLKQLMHLESIEIPRFSQMQPQSTFHVFVDASQKAYAACIFLRTELPDGEIAVTLLRAKSRVAPKKLCTIPRLELMACCIGARLMSSLKKALSLESIHTTYWSDSTTALWWIRQEGPWATFVHNRVEDIKKNSEAEQWRHVPGELNPADLPSRGCNAKQLLQSRWWEGPSWLQEPPRTWPLDDNTTPDDGIESEKRRVTALLAQTDVEVILGEEYTQYFSNYHRILRMVAWIRRFSHNSRKQEPQRVGLLSIEEIKEAENVLFCIIQKNIPKGKHSLHPSSIVRKGDLWRVKSAVVERPDTAEFRYPVLLPGDHCLVERLIEAKHKEANHAGPQILMGILREDFWIIGARRMIRKIIRRCGKCQRFRAQPFSTDPISLPKARVCDAAVFEVVGTDLAGPLFLKNNQKVWVVLFTCAVYRAVHLEVAFALSTESFLQALRRFISRRGRPRIIYSDNGTNFVGSNRALKSLDWERIQRESHVQQIQWRFNPPTAAWWGGWWERLIQTLKDLLKKTLGRTTLSIEELQTVLCDSEATINARPLTYVGEDSRDLAPLTPALFLKDIKSNGNETSDLDAVDVIGIDGKELNRRVKYRHRLSMDLRKRFRREYLGQLATSWKKRATRPVRIGEVVLIGDDAKKRIDWRLGLVTKLFPGRDGQIRYVQLRTGSGYLERPVPNIYPMEIEVQDVSQLPERRNRLENTVEKKPDVEDCPSNEQQITRRGRVVQVPKRLIDELNLEKLLGLSSS